MTGRLVEYEYREGALQLDRLSIHEAVFEEGALHTIEGEATLGHHFDGLGGAQFTETIQDSALTSDCEHLLVDFWHQSRLPISKRSSDSSGRLTTRTACATSCSQVSVGTATGCALPTPACAVD